MVCFSVPLQSLRAEFAVADAGADFHLCADSCDCADDCAALVHGDWCNRGANCGSIYVHGLTMEMPSPSTFLVLRVAKPPFVPLASTTALSLIQVLPTVVSALGVTRLSVSNSSGTSGRTSSRRFDRARSSTTAMLNLVRSC